MTTPSTIQQQSQGSAVLRLQGRKRPQRVRKARPRGVPRRSARLKEIYHHRGKAVSDSRTAVQGPLCTNSKKQAKFLQKPSDPLQPDSQKRKRPQEAEDSPCLPAESFQKRPRTSLSCPADARLPIEDTPAQEATEYKDKINLINCWRKEGAWPREYFEQGHDMSQLLARKKSTSSLHHKQLKSTLTSSTTPSNQKPREEKSSQYKNPRYEVLLETKGSYMSESKQGITEVSKSCYQTLLNAAQKIPENSLFRDDLFKATCEKVRRRNEAIIIQDITRLIVPSAENLAIYGATHLDHLVESVNEGWDNSIPVTKTRPQPDYSVGFKRDAFTDDQLRRLRDFVGELTDTSYFMATYYLYFPFLTCEVECGAASLDIADQQNAHSATIAVRATVELFKLVKREKEVDREILAFSISHDHTAVRIYGHYAVLEGEKTNFYRHPIHKFDFTALDGKEKWTAYKFTRNVYDIWMPTHFKRICSAIDHIPSDLDFEISQSELQYSEQSNAESVLTINDDDSQPSQLGYIDSTDVTPTTSFTEQTQVFKKPRK
ncbi:hypothetical protein BDBG_07404 [Blastomyces gilchristii SLH14081]|uniref:DUF7924 domain-containing protein n=2 Tax=Blastomyces gilchristii (strain SLH14081) TaxID=559298 RepID=A0A179UV44_BLAGS|nr:uncharacterized protein BDBG_07404 [Blastomyces gilchristii SLH14081]OAT11995.1 hypothetical protein BDBG_07404 [Blastomyces gilchristii SLH14081]